VAAATKEYSRAARLHAVSQEDDSLRLFLRKILAPAQRVGRMTDSVPAEAGHPGAALVQSYPQL
jgi:hypothetical protein